MSKICSSRAEFIDMVARDLIRNGEKTDMVRLVFVYQTSSCRGRDVDRKARCVEINAYFMYPYLHDKYYANHKQFIHSNSVKIAIISRVLENYQIKLYSISRTVPSAYKLPHGPLTDGMYEKIQSFFRVVFNNGIATMLYILNEYQLEKQLTTTWEITTAAPIELIVKIFKTLLPRCEVHGITDEKKYKYAGATSRSTVLSPYKRFLARQNVKAEAKMHSSTDVTILDLRGQMIVNNYGHKPPPGCLIILEGSVEESDLTEVPFTTEELHVWLATLDLFLLSNIDI